MFDVWFEEIFADFACRAIVVEPFIRRDDVRNDCVGVRWNHLCEIFVENATDGDFFTVGVFLGANIEVF